MTIPLAPVRRLMNQAGAKRIQPKAAEMLVEYIEDVIRDVTQRAVMFTEHAGRITLNTDDMDMALGIIKGK